MAKYKVGYTTGVFDVFHVGHLNILERCQFRRTRPVVQAQDAGDSL